ncbi:MAG TPA: TIGR02270 family protein [Gemmatimonadales bacterium]|nr:TIGR02270 family protein [Gemmatimonadales bacterium]
MTGQDPMAKVAIDSVVSIHAQEAASLSETRMALLRLPHANLDVFARLDERLVAHLDGLTVAGTGARAMLDAMLEDPSVGAAFAAAIRSMEDREPAWLEKFWALGSESALAFQGLKAAFGWAERRNLQGVVHELVKSADPARRLAGLSACAMHRVDPGLETGPWLSDPAGAVRSRALRSVGELGLHVLGSRCVAAATADEDPQCRFWGTWSAVLLGNRGTAVDTLSVMALNPKAMHRARAFRLTLQAMDTPAAHSTLQALARDAGQLRWLIQGSGIVADAAYVPWLIDHMTAPETARLAGEAFTLITGADLDALQLWRAQPEDFESGPNENPDDENVEMDPDEGLMWPDQEKVKRWWDANARRFQPGTRYFMGAPVTRAHCIDVLKNGYQRQRILAAHYLCLLDPGTPLFNTSAPAWRQQKLLAGMT